MAQKSCTQNANHKVELRCTYRDVRPAPYGNPGGGDPFWLAPPGKRGSVCRIILYKWKGGDFRQVRAETYRYSDGVRDAKRVYRRISKRIRQKQGRSC